MTRRFRSNWRVLPVILWLLSMLAGCAGSTDWRYLPATRAEERTVYLVAHGWHTGIVLSSEDLGPELGFVKEYLRPGRYYEFGWGEADFYQAEKANAYLFLKAVFWRNPSVIDVVSLPVTPERYFKGSEVIELTLSETGLRHMKDGLRATFKFDESHRPYPLKAGPHGESRFFKSPGYYVITHTCNKWTAQMLQKGGVPMDPTLALRAAGVMRQAREAKRRYPAVLPSGRAVPQGAGVQ